MTRNTQFLINALLTLLCYFALCAAIIAVTHSGYCRCGACEDCKLRRDGDEETMMTLTTMWPKVALFNYFAVPMPFADKATALRYRSTGRQVVAVASSMTRRVSNV